MATTINTGWLKDKDGEKFAPKTLTSQVITTDGVTLEEKLDNFSAGTVTGVKGNAETEYRTGNVNITAEDVGALPVDGTATKATQDANGNNIAGTYATKTELEELADIVGEANALLETI